MSIKVNIPSQLQKFTGSHATLEIDGTTVEELLNNLDDSCPELRTRLRNPAGQVHRFVNLYVNQEDIRFLEGTSTPLKSGDEVSIIPAVAGG